MSHKHVNWERVSLCIEPDLHKIVKRESFNPNDNKSETKRFASKSACINYYMRVGMEKEGAIKDD